jgi:hypothetical protein
LIGWRDIALALGLGLLLILAFILSTLSPWWVPRA